MVVRLRVCLGSAFFCLALAGCVSGQIIPDPDSLSKVRTLQVAALASPPILHTEDVSEKIGFSPSFGYETGFWSPGYHIYEGFRMRDAPPTVRQRKVDAAWTRDWTPTVLLAGKVVEALGRTGRFAAAVLPEIREIDGVKEDGRARKTANWDRLVRKWYNADYVERDRGWEVSTSADAVLYVEVLQEFTFDRISLQGMMKLVDPKTGRVLGRVRKWKERHVTDPKTVFQDEGRRYKEEFEKAGSDLVEQCLAEMGLAGP